MHYKTRPYVKNLVTGEGGRAASYVPRSATSTSRPVNDMRCMPVYEELEPVGDTLPRQQVGGPTSHQYHQYCSIQSCFNV